MKISYSNYEDEFDYEVNPTDAIELALEKMEKEDLISLLLDDLNIRPELEEVFYDDIKEYYEEEAWDSYRNDQLYDRDPLGYYGMSQKDFL